jgi:hypothetical protein
MNDGLLPITGEKSALTVLWAVFSMVFGLSARSRRAFSGWFGEMGYLWALVFGVVRVRAVACVIVYLCLGPWPAPPECVRTDSYHAGRLLHVSLREQHGNRLLLLVVEFCAVS